MVGKWETWTMRSQCEKLPNIPESCHCCHTWCVSFQNFNERINAADNWKALVPWFFNFALFWTWQTISIWVREIKMFQHMSYRGAREITPTHCSNKIVINDYLGGEKKQVHTIYWKNNSIKKKHWRIIRLCHTVKGN